MCACLSRLRVLGMHEVLGLQPSVALHDIMLAGVCYA